MVVSVCVVVGVCMVCSLVGVVASMSRGVSVVCSVLGSRIITAIVGSSIVAGRLGSILCSLCLSIGISSVQILMITHLTQGGLCTVMAGSTLAGISSSVVSSVRSILVTMGSSSIFGG